MRGVYVLLQFGYYFFCFRNVFQLSAFVPQIVRMCLGYCGIYRIGIPLFEHVVFGAAGSLISNVLPEVRVKIHHLSVILYLQFLRKSVA